jgi:hypothetical protein
MAEAKGERLRLEGELRELASQDRDARRAFEHIFFAHEPEYIKRKVEYERKL